MMNYFLATGFPYIVVLRHFPDTILPYKVDVFEHDLYVTTTNHSIYVMNKFGPEASKVHMLVASRGKISDIIIVQQNKQRDFTNGAHLLDATENI